MGTVPCFALSGVFTSVARGGRFFNGLIENLNSNGSEETDPMFWSDYLVCCGPQNERLNGQ